MRLLVKLSYQNLKSFLRESILVVVSIALTVSLLSMVISVMYGVFDTVGNNITKNIHTSFTLQGEFSAKDVIESFGVDNIASYTLYSETNSYRMPSRNAFDDVLVRVFNNVDDGMSSDLQLLDFKVNQGRLSQGIHELNVSKDSGYKIGDRVELYLQDSSAKITSTVVGLVSEFNFAGYYEPFEQQSCLGCERSASTLSVVVREGTKNLESLIEGFQTHLDPHTEMYTYDDYNYFKGFTSKVPDITYFFILVTVVLILLLSAITLSFLFNAFSVFMSRRLHVFGTLRSVGTTRKQISALMLLEGTALGTMGFILGNGLAYGLSLVVMKILNTSINGIATFENSKGVTQISAKMPPSALMYLAIFTFLVILVVVQRSVNGIFKYSAVNTVGNKNIRKSKKKLSLKGEVVRSLANINVRITKSFKSVKTTLVISMVILLSLTTWVDILGVYSSKYESVYDTWVSAYHSNVQDDALNILYKDSWLMEKSLKENLGIDRALVKVVSNGYKVSANFTENPEYIDYIERYKINPTIKIDSILDGGTSLVILSDEEFRLMSEGLGIANVGVGSSILREGIEMSYHLEDEKSGIYFDGDSLDLNSDMHDIYYGTTLTLPMNSIVSVQSEYDKSKAFELTVHKMAYSLGDDYVRTMGYGSQLVIGEATFDALISKDVLTSDSISAQISLKTNMSEEEMAGFGQVVKNYGGEHTFVYDSNALNIASQKSLAAGVRNGGIFVFVYLLLFIMINVISISLANFEERRSEIASLRSVGMSSKQLYKLFAFESFNIMGKSWVLGVVVGHGVGLIAYTFIRYYNRTIDFINLRPYSFNLNILILTLVLVVIVMVIQVLLVISKDKNESIIEGMRRIS